MEQDLNFNLKSLEEALKNKQNEKGKKGIQGKIDYIQNNVNNLSSQLAGKNINEEQIKYLMNNLNMVSKNLLEIFQKENQSIGMGDMGYQDQQILLNKLDEISGYQLSSDVFNGAERQPFVTKHNDILVDMNSEASQYLQKKANIQLNEKSGNDYLNQYYRTTRLFNDSIDNLLNGIQKDKDKNVPIDLKAIIAQRIKMEYEYHSQDNQVQMQQPEEEQVEYLQQDMNQNMGLQNEYDDNENIQQNDEQLEQNENNQDDDDDHI